MNLDTLPNEIVTRCFSYLSTELLTDIILLDNIPDQIVQAVAENLNHLWYSERFPTFENYKISSIEAYYETDFNRFLRIHKVLEEKSLKCPLWFHFNLENIYRMHQGIDQVNLVYNGQKLGIHADINDEALEHYPIFLDHDINLKITSLSLNVLEPLCIDLNNFPKLETFYGEACEITVDYTHPSLKNIDLERGTFSTLPVNLTKLVATECFISMDENHPKLASLTTLVLEQTRVLGDCFSLLSVLWNENLETFSYIDENARSMDEIFSMIGPKVTDFRFAGSFSSSIPKLLRSLYSINGESLENLIAFTHMSSLTLWEPSDIIKSCRLPPKLLNLTLVKPIGEIDSLKFPPNLLKLSITGAKFKDLAKVDFPPKIVDLELLDCHIKLTVGWLKPARLKRLSLESNKLSSFKADLPCCEFLYLKDNSLTDVKIEAPVLEHIDLSENKLTSFPSLPDCLQVLILCNNELDLSQIPELPSNVRRLDLLGAGTGALQNYTFPSSLRELHLTEINLSGIGGVKFAKGSKLKYLNLSSSSLSIIDDNMIEIPPGLESLDLFSNNLQSIDDLTIPQTVKSLDLGYNNLKSLKVKSHIEILNLNENPIHLNFTVPKDLELRVLDLMGIGLTEFSFD